MHACMNPLELTHHITKAVQVVNHVALVVVQKLLSCRPKAKPRVSTVGALFILQSSLGTPVGEELLHAPRISLQKRWVTCEATR
jgi:hypothetical protein